MVDIVAVTNASAQQMPAIASFFMGPFVINLAYAFLILFVGLLMGQLFKKIAGEFFTKLKVNEIVQHATSIDTKIDQIIISFITWVIYAFAVLLSFRQLGLADEVIIILLSFLFILVLVLVFLSLRDFIPNVLSGIFMSVKKYMKPGDTITSRLVSGEVVSCDLLHTSVKTTKNDLIHIPNSYIIRHKLIVNKK